MKYIYEENFKKYENGISPFRIFDVKCTPELNEITNWHSNLEVLYFYSGSGEVLYDFEKINVTNGDILIINTDVMHSIKTNNELLYICMIIDDIFWIQNGIDISKMYFLKQLKDDKLSFLIKDALIHRKSIKTDKLGNAKTRLAVLEIIIRLSEKYQTNNLNIITEKSAIIDAIKKGIKYIRENFKKNISVYEVANFSGFSKAYFSREFKFVTGLSIIAYINQIRCVRANKMLATGNYSVSQTAIECGYNNLSYFTRTYKKIIGTTPKTDAKKDYK